MPAIPLYARIVGQTVAETEKQVEMHGRRSRDGLRIRFHVLDDQGRCPCGRPYRDCCRREIRTELYSILPWTMEELPGTQWRNAHTYKLTTIQEITTNRHGQRGPDPDPWINTMFSIGLWRPVRDRETEEVFCVEHWIRVDNLPPQEQIEWAKERVTWARQELLQAQEALKKAKQEGRRIRARQLSVQWDRKYLDEARRDLISLSERFGLMLSTNILNVGVQPGEQLAMF
jgi:hypothetical protein